MTRIAEFGEARVIHHPPPPWHREAKRLRALGWTLWRIAVCLGKGQSSVSWAVATAEQRETHYERVKRNRAQRKLGMYQ